MNGPSSIEQRSLMVWAASFAVLVYLVGDLVSGLLYDGYSHTSQAISELSAFGSPVRPWMMAAILAHGVLLTTLGVLVFRVAERNIVRWIGALLIALGVVGFPTHTIWAMSSRGLDHGFNDTMHISLSAVFTLFVAAVMILSSVAYPGWFRYSSIATLVVVATFGMAAARAMGGFNQNDTPWVGAFERINAYAYFAWLVVLAITVWQEVSGVPSDSSVPVARYRAPHGRGRGDRGGDERAGRLEARPLH